MYVCCMCPCVSACECVRMCMYVYVCKCLSVFVWMYVCLSARVCARNACGAFKKKCKSTQLCTNWDDAKSPCHYCVAVVVVASADVLSWSDPLVCKCRSLTIASLLFGYNVMVDIRRVLMLKWTDIFTISIHIVASSLLKVNICLHNIFFQQHLLALCRWSRRQRLSCRIRFSNYLAGMGWDAETVRERERGGMGER